MHIKTFNQGYYNLKGSITQAYLKNMSRDKQNQLISAEFKIKNELNKCNKVLSTITDYSVNDSDSFCQWNKNQLYCISKLIIPNYSGDIKN